MDPEIQLRMALPSDAPDIAALLTRCDLPAGEAFSPIARFKVAIVDGRIVACGAAETHGESVLIRSVAVEPAYRNLGIASRLVECLLMRARSASIRHVYLVTATAPAYFSRWGFLLISAERAPEGIRGSSAFQRGHQTSPLCMRCELN